jgi:hypothetical protein
MLLNLVGLRHWLHSESIGPVADAFVGQLTGLDAAGWRRQGQVTINGMIDTVAKGDGALQDWVTSEPDVIRAPCTRPS